MEESRVIRLIKSFGVRGNFYFLSNTILGKR